MKASFVSESYVSRDSGEERVCIQHLPGAQV